MMRRFWIGFVTGLVFALTLAATRGPGFRETGDAYNTQEPGVPAMFAVPRVTSIPDDASPGTVAYVLATDGSNACEGFFAVVDSTGVRCLVVP